MSAQRTPPIPQADDESFSVFRGYTMKDALLFFPAGLTLIGTGVFAPEIVKRLPIDVNPNILLGPGFAVSLVLGLVGLITLITTPDHYTPAQWGKLHLFHKIRASEYVHQEETYDNENRSTSEEQSHGVLTSALAPNQRTQDVTGIREILPSSHSEGPGVIRMDDDTMIGAVRVHPTNLALATGQEWAMCVSDLTQVINTVDQQIKICYTTRDFDIEQFLRPYQERLDDEDVQNSPQLSRMLEDFLAWYPEELMMQGTKKSEFYVIVGVDEDDVRTTARSEGIKDQLAETPGFSLVISKDGEDMHETVLRGRQREELYSRVQDLEEQTRQIEGLDSEVVPAEDHAGLIAKAWKRDNYEPSGAMNPSPIGMTLPDRDDT